MPRNPNKLTVECHTCGKPYVQWRTTQKFCSRFCRNHSRVYPVRDRRIGKAHYWEKTPEQKQKTRSRMRFTYAVRKGHVVRQPCEVCGAKKVEGHHYKGYSFENCLEVIWLCRQHHKEEHDALRKAG